MTILLTTQYLEEADRLADDIIVIDHGRIIARGDARSLKREIGGDQLHIVCANAADVATVAAIVGRIAGHPPAVDLPQRSVTAPTDGGVTAIAAVAGELAERGIAVEDLGLRQPTLDDVFLTLTGSPPDDAGAEAGADHRADGDDGHGQAGDGPSTPGAAKALAEDIA